MDLLQNDFVVSKIALAIYLPRGRGTPIHRDRPTHGLAYYVDCSSTFRFEKGETLTCASGDCIYLPKGSNYIAEQRKDYGEESGGGVYAVNFLTLPEIEEQSPFIMHVKGRSEVQTLFSRAVNAWKRKSVGSAEECFMSLYGIIRCLKKERETYAPMAKVLSTLAPALEYIEAHYTSETITIAHLATLSGVSEPYLRRLFHVAFSVSPAVYIRNMRIRYAAELIRSGEYSVTDVATLAGFNDVTYFSREFKKTMGASPKSYGQ